MVWPSLPRRPPSWSEQRGCHSPMRSYPFPCTGWQTTASAVTVGHSLHGTSFSFGKVGLSHFTQPRSVHDPLQPLPSNLKHAQRPGRRIATPSSDHHRLMSLSFGRRVTAHRFVMFDGPNSSRPNRSSPFPCGHCIRDIDTIDGGATSPRIQTISLARA